MAFGKEESEKSADAALDRALEDLVAMRGRPPGVIAIVQRGKPLRKGGTYKAVVTTGAKDAAGNPLDQNPSLSGSQRKDWTFKVRP